MVHGKKQVLNKCLLHELVCLLSRSIIKYKIRLYVVEIQKNDY
jgi:hypothetical protein